LSVDLRVRYRGKQRDLAGYCWWKKNDDYKASIYLSQLLKGAIKYSATARDAWIAFNVQFWNVWLHEIIGHGIGHKFHMKGYSSRKDHHFEKWIDKGLLVTLIQTWKDRRIEDLEIFSAIGPFLMFDDIYKYLEENWNTLK
jgi:hypothetical protein